MERRSDIEPIRTARLELLSLTSPMVEALVAGDARAAGKVVGARVGLWLARDPSHLVQLHLAEIAANAAGFAGLGRLIVLGGEAGVRRAIGSIGFHGPPDDGGVLEAGYRIHAAYRGKGFIAEALTGLMDWATSRFGVTRFLVAVPSRSEPWDMVPIEISTGRAGSPGAPIEGLTELTEFKRR